MERVTHKTSTVVVSVGDRTRVYRSVGDVPPALRKKLLEATSGANSATILIADENGRKEIVRSLQGQGSSLEAKLLDSAIGRALPAKWTWRHWAEVGLVAGIGLCLWALSNWK